MLKLIHTLLLLGTFVCASNYYMNFQYDIPEYFYWFVFIGVIGVSVAWSFFHVVGGSLFGLAGGDVSDGVKMGAILGLGDALGRLWPYFFAWAGAAFFFAEGEQWHTYAALGGMAVCFVIKQMMRYIWVKVE